MVLRFLDVVDQGSVSLKIMQTSLDALFNFRAKCFRHAVFGVDDLRFGLCRRVSERDIDRIEGRFSRVVHGEGYMVFRMPVL